MSYYFKKTVDLSYNDTVIKVVDEFKKIGFGVVSEINMEEKFKEKLGVDFKKYKILGVCKPDFAFKAVQEEELIGLLLPCNVVIIEKGLNKSLVAVINPNVAMSIIGENNLGAFASQVANLLENALSNL